MREGGETGGAQFTEGGGSRDSRMGCEIRPTAQGGPVALISLPALPGFRRGRGRSYGEGAH